MIARRLIPIAFVPALLIPGAADADSIPAGQENNQLDPDDRGSPYFKNLKARLDAYSERQLNEMDKYQTERLFDEAMPTTAQRILT
jgi:hypothetical protein